MERSVQILRYVGLSFLAVLITSWASPIIYRTLHSCGYFSSSIGFQIWDNLISIFVAFYLFYRFKDSIQTYSDRWNAWKGLGWFCFVFVLNFILQTRVVHYGTIFYENIYAHQTHVTLSNRDPNELTNLSLAWLWITHVIFAPLFEELFFRGWLYGLWSRIFKTAPVILITTFFFAFSHLTNTVVTVQDLVGFLLTTFPATFVTGFFLGVIRARFSIIHSILMHAAVNAFFIWLGQLHLS